MSKEPVLSTPLQGFLPQSIAFRYRSPGDAVAYTNEEMHLHETCEIYVNVSGEGVFVVEDSIYPLTRGDIIITRPNELHHAVLREGVPHEHYCIWFRAEQNDAWVTRFFERERGEGNLLSPSPREKETLLSLLAAMEQAQQNPRALCASFLRLLLMIESGKEGTGERVDLPQPLGAILEELRANFREPLYLADVAARHFISQSTLNRLFRVYLHATPHSYLESLRFAEAKNMLAEGKDVTETALDCGFADASHFILLFRRRFGMTPGKYRASVRRE